MSERRHRTVRVLFLGLKALVGILPRRLSLKLGRMLGHAVYSLDRKHRAISLKNLQVAFGEEKSDAEKRRITRSSFVHFGEALFEILKLSHIPKEKRDSLVDTEGEENVQNALRKGKGVLILTAHYGNWELGIIPLSKMGEFHVIARALDIRSLEMELLAIRKSFGAKVIYKKKATRHTIRALKEKGIVAILIDQNVLHDEAIFIDFFGKTAGTTPALALFHLRTGAPIVPAFVLPTPSKRYCLRFQEGLEFPSTGDHRADIRQITQACTKIIEDQICENPEFWLWFHDRWRSQPKSEESQIS